MLLIFNGSYASSDGHPSTAAGMPSASNHFRYSDYPVVIVEKLPSEFRFEHLGSLHLLVVCFIGHGLAAVSGWLRHWVRQGSSHAASFAYPTMLCQLRGTQDRRSRCGRFYAGSSPAPIRASRPWSALMIARCAHDLKSRRICTSVLQRAVNFHPLPYSAPFVLVVDCRCASIYVIQYDANPRQPLRRSPKRNLLARLCQKLRIGQYLRFKNIWGNGEPC
jgi:hypothetical protein